MKHERTQMKRPLNQRSQVSVIGCGSSYGNDEAGWRVITALAQRDHLPARLKTFSEATELMDELGDSKLLILVDACRGESTLGAISRFEWPDPRVRQYHNHSAHGRPIVQHVGTGRQDRPLAAERDHFWN
jgi:Ni,Fe-hydrogenase maturation factor